MTKVAEVDLTGSTGDDILCSIVDGCFIRLCVNVPVNIVVVFIDIDGVGWISDFEELLLTPVEKRVLAEMAISFLVLLDVVIKFSFLPADTKNRAEPEDLDNFFYI